MSAWTDPGHIYFASIDGFDAIKIGWAFDWRKRLTDLATQAGRIMSAVAVFPGSRRDEAAIHDALAADRLTPASAPPVARTEWFSRSSAIGWLRDLEIIDETFKPRDRGVRARPHRACTTTPGSELLSAWMAANGETNRSLATRTGTSSAAIGFWRRGSNRPEHHWRVALHRLFGVHPDQWMTDEEHVIAYGQSRVSAVAHRSSNMMTAAESATLRTADGSHMNASNHCTNGHGTGFGPACITDLNAAISLND